MQEYLLKEEDEDDDIPYNSDEKISDEVEDDYSSEEETESDDDYPEDGEEVFDDDVVPDESGSEEVQRDEVEEFPEEMSSSDTIPSNEVPSTESPQGFKVMSFEDFITKK
jgi:hypothetical protein